MPFEEMKKKRRSLKLNCTNNEKIYTTKKWIGAILHHCINFSNLDKRHMFCPPGEESWCKKNKLKKHKEKINLPEWMFPILTKIFKDLSNDDLLCKCIHGETQNANEFLNNIIWMKCPKQVFVERSILQLDVQYATKVFTCF